MRPTLILLRHRVTSWVRDPSWGTGTGAGQIVLLGLLLLALFPLGLGGYLIGDVLRALFPEADALRLINGGVLYLVPVLAIGRFLFQPPPSERVATYVSLPIPKTGLLHGQMILSLLSLHTVLAVVLVGPVWAAEILGARGAVGAAAWLAVALLLTVVLPSHGATLLQLLLGRRPGWGAGALVGIALAFAADAAMGPDLFRGLSRAVFGRPVGGLIGAAAGVGGTHLLLLRAMRARLEVDRRAGARAGGPSPWGRAVYRWVERTLPAGRLVALEVRQIARTRRLRSLALVGCLMVVYFYGFSLLTGDAEGLIDHGDLVMICLLGVAGPTYGLGQWIFGTWAAHATGLFARPHPLPDIMRGRILVLWAGLVPGTVVTAGVLPWLPLPRAAVLLGVATFWWGVVVPTFVYLGPHVRTPVDPAASMFTMNTNTHGLRLLPIVFAVILAPLLVLITGTWWGVAGVYGGLGLAGVLFVAGTVDPFARKLDRHRREMLEGFRERESI